MLTYSGKGIVEGITIGKISVYAKGKQQVQRIKIQDADAELIRFEKAKKRTEKQLQDLHDKAVTEVGEANAAIFDRYRMLLEDVGYNESVENIVRMQMVNAEYAVDATGDFYGRMFARMEDEYMRERAADVKDVSEQLLSVLEGKEQSTANEREPIIILADDLAPSETVRLDKEKVLSFVTVHGSVNSHTAILAKTMGIPALIGTDIPLDDTVDGKMAIVDGTNGKIYVDPDEETLFLMKCRQAEELEKKHLLQELKGKENITLDGKKVMICANIGSIKDLQTAVENDADGIGLFRSEFIYLGSEDHPTEEEQFEVYKTAVEAMAGKLVIIRTLDIGADKQCDYFRMEKEENPALGYRAIRICLDHPEIFKVQLRALFRASVYGKLAIMYPMITSLSEVEMIKKIVEEVKEELTERNIGYAEPEHGIMIETPAAVMISDLLAKEVDFFSIGTNDLSQYTMAIDRQNPKLEHFYDAHHPAVLRMIRMVIENAHKAGIRVGICGELGADPSMTQEFLAMGVDELSVAPGRILPIRKIVRETNTLQLTLK
ncbi:MAG: phosphoenolpyruvate--protein phosphotransferase [Clostridia bacterium]|nr:phosphoenolpyruvate--protein phosphotransferase [Clostridia bacterium]